MIWILGDLPESVAADIRSTGASLYRNDLDPQANLVLAHRLAIAMARVAGRDPDMPPHLNRSVRTTTA